MCPWSFLLQFIILVLYKFKWTLSAIWGPRIFRIPLLECTENTQRQTLNRSRKIPLHSGQERALFPEYPHSEWHLKFYIH